MAKNIGLKRFFEVSLVMIIVFVVIMIIFAVVYFGFGLIKKGIHANVISSETETSVGSIDWIIIFFVTAAIVVFTLKKLAKKDLFKISFKKDREK